MVHSQTNQLEQCSLQEINNSYDNTILYTDYFLAKTIQFLKNYSKSYDTTMIYMSDHGESLGENGIYLHGLPYFMAPTHQTHIASLIWSNNKSLLSKINTTKKYSHDNIFHTLLGLYEIQTKVYNKHLDLLNLN